MDNSAEGSYDMILGGDLITALGLDKRFSKHFIIDGSGLYEGCLSPMNNLNDYEVKYLSDNIVKPEEYFINSYIA